MATVLENPILRGHSNIKEIILGHKNADSILVSSIGTGSAHQWGLGLGQQKIHTKGYLF